MYRFVLFVLLVFNVGNLIAKDIFVGGSGASDSNTGTAAQPYATIQKAASVAVSGDVIKIRSGTYRETITPSNSGITFMPDGAAVVVVSGLNEVGNDGWSVHNGNIYKKSITLPVNGYNLTITGNTTIAANQLFRNGTMQIEARWPDAGSPEELLNRANFRQRNSVSNWTNTTLTDQAIPNIPGGWQGGKIWITGWFIAQSRTITGHSGTTINYNDATSDLRFLQYYYLTGKLGALSIAKEWHYENGTLYFWQEGGGSPTGVEYKARNWGFDLRDRSNITITGIRMKGCEVNGNNNTSNITIDNIRAEYINHTVLQEGSDVIYYNARQTGFKLYGTNNTVKNSEFKYAASNGIELGGGGRVENNLFEYMSYEGNYGAPVLLHDNGDNQKILRNTFRYIGRSALDYGYVNMGHHYNVEVGYNDAYNFGMLSADGGAFYVARYIDLKGSRIHHNWIHNSKAEHTPTAGFDAGINAGIYYDQATGSGTTNDHNVLWDNRQCDLHVSTGEPDRNLWRGKAYFYNNTLVTKVYDNYVHGYFSYLNIVSQYYDVHRNNIYRARNINVQGSNWVDAANGTAPFDVQNCLFRGVDPMFDGTGQSGLIYRVKQGSPAVNAGAAIPNITDGAVGTPDIGAYELGGEAWVPGFKAVATNLPSNSAPVVAITGPAY